MNHRKDRLTAGQVLTELQIHPDTLRNWERRGILHPSKEPYTGWRLYEVMEVERIKNRIKGNRRQGLSVLEN